MPGVYNTKVVQQPGCSWRFEAVERKRRLLQSSLRSLITAMAAVSLPSKIHLLAFGRVRPSDDPEMRRRDELGTHVRGVHCLPIEQQG